ncbi:hypothetical protein ZHAS_00021100 [Anopheles sinensis]|uniref:Uncharacterized protein n=1 Tax=Anopheles sinensis TaxID=74873 RepID=A0A084WRI7_ANOSI|nr:hypothetical protein ZHAS_00021100 [Anopheles sinensis]
MFELKCETSFDSEQIAITSVSLRPENSSSCGRSLARTGQPGRLADGLVEIEEHENGWREGSNERMPAVETEGNGSINYGKNGEIGLERPGLRCKKLMKRILLVDPVRHLHRALRMTRTIASIKRVAHSKSSSPTSRLLANLRNRNPVELLNVAYF